MTDREIRIRHWIIAEIITVGMILKILGRVCELVQQPVEPGGALRLLEKYKIVGHFLCIKY